MSARLILLAVMLLGLAGLVGWRSAESQPTNIVAARSQRFATPQIEHAGLQTALAVKVFESLGLGAPPPPEVSVAPEADAPPEIDIVIQFRYDLTAILREGEARAALIVDRENGGERRLVRAGQPYREGWRIAEIGVEEIVLRRGEDARAVSIMAWNAAQSPQ